MLVDILIRDNKPYTYENHACKNVQLCFEALGIKSRKIVFSSGIFQDYLKLLEKQPPTWTLTFEEIFSLQKPFCDILKIPNFFWKNGFLSSTIHHFTSKYGKVGCVDRRVASHFEHLFFPHSCEKKPHRKTTEKVFDVVLFQDLIDLESKKNTWEILFGVEGAKLLLDAVVACKTHPHLHPAIVGLSFKNDKMNLSDLIFELEEYLKAERTLELIESLKNVCVDVFGEHVGSNWLLRLKNRKNVRLHSLLPYREQFEVLKLTKVLIRDQPSFSEASDEWILHALNEGCFVFTNPNPYLLELFKEMDCFYHSFEELNEKINAALQSEMPFLPKEISEKNCWDSRVKEMVQYMGKLQ